MKNLFGFSVSLLLAALFAMPTLATDNRVIVGNTEVYPWSTVTCVKIGPEGNGRGSAFLVGPYTFLTNGHVVYNRSEDYFRTIPEVVPGQYYSTKTEEPFGDRAPVNKATNTSYVSTGETKYDYGAIFIGTPFSDITTYMPVIFEYDPSYVNVSGYPCEDLPSTPTGATKEQWFGHGDVDDVDSRVVYYQAVSTGGASGSPVWVYNEANGRRVVAVNQGHSSDHPGIGVRFVDQNESVVTDWIEDPPVSKSSLPGITWTELLNDRLLLNGKTLTDSSLLSVDQLGLIDPDRDGRDNPEPICTVAQWIENTFYKWEEYEVISLNKSDAPQRYIKMLQPEEYVLSTEEAQVLLTASRLWEKPEMSLPAVETIVLPDLDPVAIEDFEDVIWNQKQLNRKAALGLLESEPLTETTFNEITLDR